jgi:hypothetical protein
MLTYPHLPSPALAHRRPLDQSTPAVRVHFWPLVSAAAMGSHGGVVSGLHARYVTQLWQIPGNGHDVSQEQSCSQAGIACS